MCDSSTQDSSTTVTVNPVPNTDVDQRMINTESTKMDKRHIVSDLKENRYAKKRKLTSPVSAVYDENDFQRIETKTVDADQYVEVDDDNTREKINSRERDRMHQLNVAMDALRDVIPLSRGPSVRKLSTIGTLQIARSYITTLTQSLDEMRGLLNGVYRPGYRQGGGMVDIPRGDVRNFTHQSVTERCGQLTDIPRGDRNIIQHASVAERRGQLMDIPHSDVRTFTRNTPVTERCGQLKDIPRGDVRNITRNTLVTKMCGQLLEIPRVSDGRTNPPSIRQHCLVNRPSNINAVPHRVTTHKPHTMHIGTSHKPHVIVPQPTYPTCLCYPNSTLWSNASLQ